jgi:8-oxo-dGTP pyrophosphatase MutT (NUDIX family)
MERTWDGEPISLEPPFGASIIVFRRAPGLSFLILHRTAPGIEEGDWAWTPPAGARKPGERIEDAASRELFEEAGLRLPFSPAPFDTGTWTTYLAEAPPDAVPTLHDVEHDRWMWVDAAEAVARCQPPVVSDTLRQAARHLCGSQQKKPGSPGRPRLT